MTSVTWLSLTDYSTKYRVSVSTLRRRIKSDDISFRFRNGKYFLKDEAQSLHRWHRPSQEINGETPEQTSRSIQQEGRESNVDSVLETTNKLISELKSAYGLILKEKEEQIILLRSEVADLRTFVSVLESENDKLKKAEVSPAFLSPHRALEFD